MIRIFTISVFMMMIISSYGQARLNSDGLYYDEQGNLFTGVSYDYYSDSLTRSVTELVEGRLDGLTKLYFDNGQIEEIRSFNKGMMNGKWERWNRQNIRIAEASYVDNIKDGKWYIWDDNGTLRYDMTYKLGVKTGTWLMFDDKGKLISQKDY